MELHLLEFAQWCDKPIDSGVKMELHVDLLSLQRVSSYLQLKGLQLGF